MSDMKKENDKCVTVNIIAKCDGKNDYYDDYKKKESNSCVVVNIYVSCDEDRKKYCQDKKEKENCVEVNIFAECGMKKYYESNEHVDCY